jgi:hypothetical protein
LAVKPEGKRPPGNVGIDGRIILKWFLKLGGRGVLDACGSE